MLAEELEELAQYEKIETTAAEGNNEVSADLTVVVNLFLPLLSPLLFIFPLVSCSNMRYIE